MALSKGYPSNYASFHHSFPDFSQAANRLKTFSSPFRWPKETGITPEQLSVEGFIFSEPPDLVECVYCGLKLHTWSRGIVPLEVQFRKSQGKCDFAMKRKGQKESNDGEFLSVFYDRRTSGYQSGCTYQYSISSVRSHHSTERTNQSANQIPTVLSKQTTADGTFKRPTIPKSERKTSETSAHDKVAGISSTPTGQIARNPERNEDLYSTQTQPKLSGMKTLLTPTLTDERTSVRSSSSESGYRSTNYSKASTSLERNVRTDASLNDGPQFQRSSRHKEFVIHVSQSGNNVRDAYKNLKKPPLVHVPKTSGACFRPSFSSEAAESAVFSGNSSEIKTIQPDPPFKPEQCENDDVTKSLISLVFDSDASGTTVKSKLDSKIPFGYYLNSAMDTDKVKLVLHEGYNRDVVLAVVTHRLKTDGDNFRSAVNLLKAVFDYEDAAKAS